MALEQRLSLKLAQKLVMTPSLQQAIKLLQMTRLELEGVLTQELVENPVLEETTEAAADEEPAEAEPEEVLDGMDEIDFEAFFSDAESWETSGKSSLFEQREGPPLENTLTREPDLYDHLMLQLQMMDLDPETREIAELVIGNLNPEGFLVATVEEIQAMGVPPSDVELEAAEADLERQWDSEGQHDEPAPAALAAAPAEDLATASEGEPEVEEPETEVVIGGYLREAVEKAFEVVRNLDPPGVACFTLRESLLRQLEAKGVDTDGLTYRVIDEAWDLFKHRKFEAVAKQLEVPLAELEAVVEEVRGLDTRPGRRYDNGGTQYVEPDVYVVKVGDKYVIQLNDDGLPRLRVSGAYRKMLQILRHEGKQSEAQQYIKDKMRSALWLIKSLDQRQRTIYKVATSIVRQQRAFLDYGLDHLRPMVLRDVAEDIEMHESTVSRVVSNKYIHTARGLFPLKFFFHSGIDREYGGDISSLTVKRKIQHLIQEENSRKPLSDSELMRVLNREGIQIARRTVAKYRDELGIPSSTDRKQIF